VRRLAPAFGLGAIAAVCLLASAADADFTPAALLSGTPNVQFTEAKAPALATEAPYAVFQGVVGGVEGVFRRNLETGQIQPVATSYAGKTAEFGAPAPAFSTPEAASPSVSANGQYVAFTTIQDLEPQELPDGPGEPSADQGCPEVYVRDMQAQPAPEPALEAMREHPAYKLASAGFDYEDAPGASGPVCPRPPHQGFAIAGAQAAPAVALSANGQQVAFTVLSWSNLDEGQLTPPSQVAVHNFETGATTLVSVTPEGKATPNGGAYPSTYSEAENTHEIGGEGGFPVESQGSFGDEYTGSSAAISADGSTVAWLGTNITEQVPGSPTTGGGSEVEPLWRRIANGASATTERLLGAAGLDFGYFQWEEGKPVELGALVSPSVFPEFIPPVLSKDGRTVAVLANAPPTAGVESARLSSEANEPSSNVYVVHIPAETETPVVTPLTVISNYAAPQAAVGNVIDLAISAEGTRVAFETMRTQFDSPPVALVSPPNSYTHLFETYVANLALGTLQRVTNTYDGAEPNGSASLLSFSGDEQTLAFASRATNLFFGDAIDASEVYLANEEAGSTEVAPTVLQAPPPGTAPGPDWLLSATAAAEANGEVTVYAQVPGAGSLAAVARAQIPPPSAVVEGRHKRSHASPAARPRGVVAVHRRGRRQQRPPAAGGVGGTAPTSTVALAGATAVQPTELELHLRVEAPFATLVDRATGLYAIVNVTFTAPGRPALSQQIPVTFHLLAKTSKAGKYAKRSAKNAKNTAGHRAGSR
jgi:hypothetical protein